jgi:hypothetical protein
MLITDIIKKAVLDNGSIERKDIATYLGPVTHRIPNLHIRTFNEDSLKWRKQDSSIVPDELGSIYLPLDFWHLEDSLRDTPLLKAGIEEDAEKNIAFLQCEVLNWLGLDDRRSQDIYKEIWSAIPNVSKYSSIASERIPELVDKLNSLLSYKGDTNCRSFELRFPTEYCPLVWSIILTPEMNALEASLVFRSVEVSRNILNDIYLFCVYFGYIFSQYKESKLFDINIQAVDFFAQDAHIIDFGI